MGEFSRFWGMLIFKPREFFQNEFKRSESPYFLLVLLVYGFSDQLDRMDNQMMKMANGRLGDGGLISENWLAYIVLTIVFGLLSGLLYHYLGGWWFNMRVGFSGGKKDVESSRFIFLYSLFPVGFAKLFFFLPIPLKYATPMEAYLSDDPTEMVGAWIVIALVFYSLYISYSGAVTLFEVKKGAAKFWFLWLPGIFYALAFGFLMWFFIAEDIV